MNGKTVKRIHRVRTLQLGLARAEEAQLRGTLADESALQARIADLAVAVATAPSSIAGNGLAAAAHFRERLHQSAAIASGRVRVAQDRATAAAAASRAAHRDQTAVEKLLTRAQADDAIRAMRALADVPGNVRKRHEPC